MGKNQNKNGSAVPRVDWETPRELWSVLDDIFNFRLDLAANRSNTLCTQWIGPGGVLPDITATDKKEIFDLTGANLDGYWCWCNPPYGREYNSKMANALIKKIPNFVALVPASTGASWWQRYMCNCDLVCFLPGRLRFGGGDPAPFDSTLFVAGDLLSIGMIDEMETIGVCAESL